MSGMTIHEAVSQRIRELCEEKNWSINELVKRSNVKQSTVSEFMTGRSKHPRISTIEKIANGFGMTLSEFFDSKLFEDISDK